MGILHWLRLKTGVTQELQRARTSSFEPLEPRVLLSADLAGVQPALACESGPADQAIHVDLNGQSPAEQQEPSPILTFEALSDDEASQSQTAPELEQTQQQAVELFSLSPALFVENQGQWSDPSVRYVHDGDRIDVAMTDTGVVFRAVDTDLQLLQFSASFVGANVVRPVGLEQSASLFNYYLGDQTNWRQNVPSYEVVAYEGLYEGVDLRVRGLRSHVKYEFHVAPGADYRRIAVHYEGLEGLSIGEDGSLQVNLGAGRGVIRDDAPYIYQEIDGQRMEVAGRFILLDSQTYSFEITGVIDPDHALVIDPDLVWSTYLGGTDRDEGAAIAVDTDGYVYVTGKTASAAWTSGGFDTIHANAFDAFVVKLSAGGQHVWSTYLGGDVNDAGSGIAVDADGYVYVTGTSGATGGTDSPNWTSGGFDTTFGGNWDAFVVKLSSGGAHLWSTFLGGSGYDWGYGIAVDSSGNAYVTGYTDSSGWASGGYDTRVDGTDAFVAKISSDGTQLLWSTYIGGNDWLVEGGNGIAVDSSGNAYVTGYTESSGWTSGGFNPVYNGGPKDAFVVKLSSSGAHVWSTYLGGGSSDVGYGIAVSPSGNVYVTGNTNSSGWTSGGFDTTYNGGYGSGDAFVVKLSSGGAHLWSTYLGGVNDESGYGIAVDVAGNAWVMGSTYSPDWTSGGFDTTYNEGSSDAFVARLRSGGALLWSTYLGGGASDSGYGIAVDASGHAYATGTTASSGWTSGGFDTTFNGGSNDAFVVRIDDPDTTPPTIGGFSVSPTSVELGGTFTISYTVSDSGGSGLNRVELWRTDDPGSWPAPAVETHSLNAAEDGPISGSFSNAPPTAGNWWYGLRVYDTAGNLTTQTTPIQVVVDPALPPSPNPSTWATVPEATGPNSIRMEATVATDPSGVEYYFHETTGHAGATDSDWQDSNVYEDTGLSQDTVYTYEVKTRDRLVNPNEGAYSAPASATTDADTTLPTIISFTVSPAEVTLGGSFLVTYTVSDDGGAGLSSVELWRIDNLGASERVAENSAVGNGPVTGYLSDDPPSAGTWTYGLNVSDAAGNRTASDQSPPVVVNPPDTTPPSPNPSTWATAPHGTGPHSISMAATPATDPSGVEYYFHEMSGNPGATDSDWQDSNVYEDTGLSPGMLYKYEVRTRDKSTNQNVTAYSASASAATASPVYRFWKQSDNTHFYTIKESERLKLIKNYSDVYTYEGVAFYAYVKDLPPAGTLPVYRFWKPSDSTHFYTIDEGERQKLIKDYSSVYTFEGVAYYAFMAGQQPTGTLPVYRFWKSSGNTHFYTIMPSEKDLLILQYSSVFTYEKIVWYAYVA
jgi:hypothetical protein